MFNEQHGEITKHVPFSGDTFMWILTKHRFFTSFLPPKTVCTALQLFQSAPCHIVPSSRVWPICVVAFLHVSRSLPSGLMMLTEGSFLSKLSVQLFIPTDLEIYKNLTWTIHARTHILDNNYCMIINRPGKCNTFPNFSPSIVNKHDFSLWYQAIP